MSQVWQIFWHETGFLGKLVLAILLGFSILSWMVMAAKAVQIRRARALNRRFQERFRKCERLFDIRDQALRFKGSTLSTMFLAAFAELERQFHADPVNHRILHPDNLRRELERTGMRALREMRTGLPFLATTASATPFIGLFGTVWGIMNAFRQIGIAGSANLATVAPGISEALINTAAGLGAAIPALIGYNHFMNRLRTVKEEQDEFILEVENLLTWRIQ
jgi:biopolymer transport protein TolQ